jgi:OOP family OmpA-OmpF porin
MRTVLALALVVAASSSASAGTYIGVGIGTGANVSDEINTPYVADGRSARGVLGYRIGPFSVEGAVSGYGLVIGNEGDGGQFDSRSVQIAGKYNFAIGDKFELFGRLGLLRTDLNGKQNSTNASGDGYTFSLGVEYRLDLIATGLGLYMDWTRNSTQMTLDSGVGLGNQTASMWTLGLNLAL